MAHFAKLDSDNIVTQVVVVDNSVLIKADGTESELKGKQFLNSLFGTATWKQTSYNGNFRNKYANCGDFYDAVNDKFIPYQPYNSWTYNDSTNEWEPPIEHPTDGNLYNWDEDNQEWVFSRAIVTP